jgi:antitoxin (DNA-binding transcriptional repressor) of toxin-antitoxin stability system
MKTATAEQIPQQWPEILHWLASDEEVQIVESGRIVARIVPPLTHDLSPKTPDYVGRAQAIWGAKPEGATLSEIVHDSRGTGA